MNRLKDSRINVRVTPELRERIEALAEREAMGLGEMARMLFREGVARTRAPDAEAAAIIRSLVRELQGIAVNLNQLARTANLNPDDSIEADTRSRLTSTANEVIGLLNMLRADLHRFRDWRE